MDPHHRHLRERFVARLLALRPASVLDLGCGRGELLTACREAGVEARGLEPDAAAAAEARAAGLAVEEGDAARLGFADGSFDWVTLRHVPHHLERPERVFAEAWRVARAGLLVAEPWYDASLPSQRAAREVDVALKHLDRARGRFHADVLGPAELLALLPEPPARVELETCLELAPWTGEELEGAIEEALEGAPPTPAESALLARARARAAGGELTRNGTLILTLHRGASASVG